MQRIEEKLNGRDVVVSSKPNSVIGEKDSRNLSISLKDGKHICDIRIDILGNQVLISVVNEDGKNSSFLDKMDVS